MGKFGSNWLIGYRDIKCWRKFMLDFIWYQFIRKVWLIWKKCHWQNNFSFWFYVSIPNFVWINQILSSKRLKMLDIFLSIFMAPKCVWRGLSRGANFFPNKYAETNIPAKFDAFIRDVNVCLIFSSIIPLTINNTF